MTIWDMTIYSDTLNWSDITPICLLITELDFGLQGSVNVHRGALLLVPQWQCISSFVFYIITYFDRITKFRGFPWDIATSAASQQRTRTPQDTWSCPIWDLHLF